MVTTRMAPLRIGIVGTGRIGRLHAQLLQQQVAGATVAAVLDARHAAAEELARELDVPVAADVDELLGLADAVAICSSTDTHAELIVAAAEAGRPIFCEKPVSLDLDEVDRALAAVTASGVPFQIGFNRRFDPAHAAVRDAVTSGAIGVPHLVRITSRDPAPPPIDYVRVSGGLFLDMTIHDFDMARFITGSEVTEVFARGTVRIDPAIAAAHDVDTALVTLVHADGCLTAVDNSRRAVYGYDQRVEAFGSGGMASSENPPSHSTVVRTADGTHAARPPDFFLDRYVPSYVREWAAFVHAVRTGTPTPVGPADARAPLLIGLAALRSMRENRPVPISELEHAAA